MPLERLGVPSRAEIQQAIDEHPTIKSGTDVVTFGGVDNFAAVTVTFTTPFSTVPEATANCLGGSSAFPYIAVPGVPTVDSVVIRVVRRDGTVPAADTTVNFVWTATDAGNP